MKGAEMEHLTLKVRLFGTISITMGDIRIGCDSGRSRQVWMILAYLLHHRNRRVPSEELITLLHLEEKGANPAGALKTAMHRVRTQLDKLGDGMGHLLLQYRDNGYGISPDAVIEMDTELLEAALASPAEITCNHLLDALDLYTGGFCSAFSDESWVIPLNVYYQNLYTRGVQTAAKLLENEQRYEDCAELCQQAIQRDPYREVFCQLLMRSLLALGRREQVITVYENMSRLMLSAIGVMPDQESRALYREALKTVNRPKISPEALANQLKESDPISGALYCDFDFFRNVYQSQARLLLRSGEQVHIALLNLTGRTADVSRRSLETAMDNLAGHLCRSLRKGDVVTRCSSTQFVIMLPHAGYEDSCQVCRRLSDSYFKKYPHTPVRLDWNVQSVDPAGNTTERSTHEP